MCEEVGIVKEYFCPNCNFRMSSTTYDALIFPILCPNCCEEKLEDFIQVEYPMNAGLDGLSLLQMYKSKIKRSL